MIELGRPARGSRTALVRTRDDAESTVTLVRETVRDVTELAQAELALAKLELEEGVTRLRDRVRFAAPRLAAGAFVVVVGSIVTLTGIVALLDVWLPLWAALLVVGVPSTGVGAFLLMRAVRPPAPDAEALAALDANANAPVVDAPVSIDRPVAIPSAAPPIPTQRTSGVKDDMDELDDDVDARRTAGQER